MCEFKWRDCVLAYIFVCVREILLRHSAQERLVAPLGLTVTPLCSHTHIFTNKHWSGWSVQLFSNFVCV